RIYAYDSDKNRFKGIFERLKRAGAHNVQTLRAGDTSALDALAGRLDMILIDAPCTGSGTWRRKPDAKWRLSERTMKERLAVQVALLDQAARFSKKGASIIYITCSLLERENHAQVSAFLGRNTDFVSASLEAGDLLSIDVKGKSSVQLTPACHETDGFFVSKFVRASG
ncbi:MAG: RsmB/NOP family class I SAM-dependent RNA methyltransferase, partial [Alphaproteobacteria bacterium]|nr:RsmB/NOP family class I SAM-dependent RNA methyltransferase [Alphaproteobacteria bacterium]